tara:strand:- start:20 stop:1318 length:1299 start_codon:yes stop_codon:yes gene_type:complete
MSKTKDNSETKVIEVENMDEILGTAASVAISGGDAKPTFFSKNESDTTFLDKPGEAESGTSNDEDEDEDSETKVEEDFNQNNDAVESNNESENLDAILGNPSAEIDEEDDDSKTSSKGGRKPAMVETLTKLINNNSIELFEDQQDLSSYTNDDMVDLIEANINKRVQQTAKDAPLDMFKRLDPKIQDLVAFQLNGGTDISSVLKVVSQSQEITELDVTKEKDQERIIREWFRSTGSYNEDELEDEITSIMDRGDLEKKATQFKPKLDDKQSLIMKKKLDEQEQSRERAEVAKNKWGETIFHNLNKPDLNGIPLSNKVQTMLYHGLTDNTTYQDRNGNPTNALGHFIEEYQYGQNANPSILAEALWLMANPSEYRQHVLSLGKKQTQSETFRNLKTAEGERTSASSKQGEQRDAPVRGKGIKKTVGRKQIFSR